MTRLANVCDQSGVIIKRHFTSLTINVKYLNFVNNVVVITTESKIDESNG